MLVLTIRTDNPEAEVGLYEGEQQVAYEKWQAHRELSATIHQQVAKILQQANKDWSQIDGVIVFKGPGSFTGLRIGLSVANALAAGLHIPIVGESGDNWQQNGLSKLLKKTNQKIILPNYGAPAKTTTPKN